MISDAGAAIDQWLKDHLPALSGLGLVPHDLGDGQTVYIDPSSGTMLRQYPDGSISSWSPATNTGVTSAADGTVSQGAPSNLLDPSASAPQMQTASSSSAGAPPMADWKQMALWLGALAALWLALTMLADAGFDRLAYALASLILGGAALYMGPKAVENAQTLFK